MRMYTYYSSTAVCCVCTLYSRPVLRGGRRRGRQGDAEEEGGQSHSCADRERRDGWPPEPVRGGGGEGARPGEGRAQGTRDGNTYTCSIEAVSLMRSRNARTTGSRDQLPLQPRLHHQ